jgi:hypothetical protein
LFDSNDVLIAVFAAERDRMFNVDRPRACDPDHRVSQIALLMDGAVVTGLTMQPPELEGELVEAAMKLAA